MSAKAHGSQKFTQFTHYKSSETDHNDVNLHHGYRYPPNGPYDSYTHTHQQFTSFPSAHNDEASLLSIWVSKSAQPLNNQPQVSSPPSINQNEAFQENYNSHSFGGRDSQKSLLITYYAPYKRMTIHFPRVPRTGAVFRLTELILYPWDQRMLHSSGYPRERNLYRVVHDDGFGILLMRAGDYVLPSPEENRSLTYCVPGSDIVVHYTTFPRDGDIFCPRQIDNVITLHLVQMENFEEYHSPDSSGCPRNRSLYRAYKTKEKFVLERMADDILVFHEENETATYYLSDKDIVLHFTKVPRDGDIFCSHRDENVVILETLPVQTSQEHHIKNSLVYPWDRDLYCVHENNGRFLLVKLEDNDMPPEESYTFGEIIYDGNHTFTCYLNYMHMAFHFNTLPTDGDTFLSRVKISADDHHNCFYGSPLDIVSYCVKQRDAGFELVKTRSTETIITPEYNFRLQLKIRRYVMSCPSSDNKHNVCAVCLDAYKNFDRIGRLNCGHE